jgi:hypothetical protein
MLDFKFLDTAWHRMELYLLDWYNLPGTQTIKVEDVVSGGTIDQRTMVGFSNGLWVAWNLRGHVRFHVTRTGSAPAIVSGIFFDPTPVLPSITITSPNMGDVFVAPATITIRADAAADTNNVQRIDFYDGPTLLGSTSKGPPFTFVWDDASLGRRSLTAREVGPAGTADSVPVIINVVNSTDLTFIDARKSPEANLILDAFVPAGALVRLEASSGLEVNGTTWTPVATNTSGSNHIQFILPDPSIYTRRFYRMRILR